MTSSSVLSRKGWARMGYQWTLVSGDGASRRRCTDRHTHTRQQRRARKRKPGKYLLTQHKRCAFDTYWKQKREDKERRARKGSGAVSSLHSWKTRGKRETWGQDE
ncbi:hypothetical protein QQF64_027554 [Cirrhinus molitorella]|uniref:Uncharacterized protein n=1 Tax=Cirrhinus molitorella TaxID=172907 RepID=A0ABR3NCQ3_9TELE